jgi:hypothetical protein
VGRAWRCFGSNYRIDPEAVMDDLIQTLDRMQIKPIGVRRSRCLLPVAASRSLARRAEPLTPLLVRYAHEIIARLVTKIMTADRSRKRQTHLPIARRRALN